MFVLSFIILATGKPATRAETTRNGFTVVHLRNGTSIQLEREMDDAGIRQSCKHSRAQLIQDALQSFDTNNDACISKDELTIGFNNCLTWYERLGMRVGSAVGHVHTPAKVIDECDRTGDGLMCLDDYLLTSQQCAQVDNTGTVSTCLCGCESMDMMYKMVLNRIPCK